MLSCNDRCRALNELGGMLAAGRLAVGDEVVHEYDHGLARVTFRVDPPGDREELEAYGVPPWASVLPVRWSLTRQPEGRLRPLTEEGQSRARQVFDEIAAGLDRDRPGPPGWQVPVEPRFDPDQRFGPLTPVVLARAAQLWQADDRTLRELLAAGLAAARGLVAQLTEGPGRLSDVVGDLAVSCLMVEAVADLAGAPLLLEARGPWVSGVRGERVISDPRWRAAPEVLETLRGLLAPLDAHTVGTVAGMHEIACRREVEGAAGYGQLCARLEAWALTSAAACPWTPVLAKLLGWEALLDPGPGGTLGRLQQLESWATCIASALVHRARLSSADIDTLTLLHAADLPRLREVLDTPV